MAWSRSVARTWPGCSSAPASSASEAPQPVCWHGARCAAATNGTDVARLDTVKEVVQGYARRVSGPVALILAGVLAAVVGGVGMIATSWLRSPPAAAAGTPAHTFQTKDLSAAPPVSHSDTPAAAGPRSSRATTRRNQHAA